MRNDEAISACVAAVQRGAPVDGLLALPHEAKVALLRAWLAQIRDPYAIVRSLSEGEVRSLHGAAEFALADLKRGTWRGAPSIDRRCHGEYESGGEIRQCGGRLDHVGRCGPGVPKV